MALKIALEILSPLLLTKREDGEKIFDLWQKYLSGLLPDRFGYCEPIDQPFDPRDIETALNGWQWSFFAVKRRPAVDASIFKRKATQRLHAGWSLAADVGAASQAELITFLKMASVTLQADFSCLHLLTQSELQRGRASGVVTALDKKATKFHFLIASRELQQRIPDLFWATVLGGPYVEMFGRDRLLSAPAFSAESLSNETVLLQTTEKLTDVEQHSDVFNEARSRIKAHLGRDAFFRTEDSGDRSYRAPQFKFEEAQSR
jgi:hypothetical protein